MNTEIQAPELPAAFIDRISSMGGSASEAVLAMRKQLTSDDVSNYNELQIEVPNGQLENPCFVLNDDEKERLESGMKVRVLMLDSSCIDTAPYYVYLGRCYYCYCLRNNWGEE